MKYGRYLMFVLFAATLNACAWPDPYVYREDEFNRESATFKVEPKDLDVVVVCYNANGATPQDVKAIAAAECGKFGKRALFRRHVPMTCPLFTPSSAEFACLRR